MLKQKCNCEKIKSRPTQTVLLYISSKTESGHDTGDNLKVLIALGNTNILNLNKWMHKRNNTDALRQPHCMAQLSN